MNGRFALLAAPPPHSRCNYLASRILRRGAAKAACPATALRRPPGAQEFHKLPHFQGSAHFVAAQCHPNSVDRDPALKQDVERTSTPIAVKTTCIALSFLVCSLSRAEVQLNELMASNTRAYPDITDFEDYPDWIELHNTGATAASLSGLFLSDDPADPFKWPVPATASIPGSGYLLLMADGHDAVPGETHPRGYWPWKDFTTEKYHTNFSLGATGETVTLARATGISSVPLVHASTPAPTPPATLAVWKYLDDGSDQSTQWRARVFNDASWASGPAELGYGDSPATTVSYGPDSENKYITTYFRHSFAVPDPSAYHGLTLKLLVDDGCIVYLNGAEVIRRNMPAGEPNYKTLASIGVSGTTENTFFPYTLPVSGLVAGDNILAVEVHESSADSSDISLDLELSATAHTGFSIVDSVTFGQQVPDVSYGRDAANLAQWKQFAQGTPGASNASPVVDDVRHSAPEVTISTPAGLYASSQNVTLSSPSGVIRYTLDGSTPKTSSPAYSAPLAITATTILRARCFEAGKTPGPIATRTYFLGETQGSLPYVSVVADPETLFGNSIGIYKNTHESVSGSYGEHDVYKGKDAPGNVEYFAPGGTLGFTAGCGIRIGGENNWVHPQKALNIAISGKYGTDDVTYNLFPDSGIPLHTAFTLRDGGDNWNKDMLRDCLYPRLAKGYLNVDTADYRPSIVFVNGAYFGLHDLRQRWDETWFAQQYHVPPDKIDHLLYGHITSSAVTLGVDKGSSQDWLDLMAFLNSADLTTAANWAYVESKIDLDSFIDFVVSESYGNNTSWFHNREFWREKSPSAKWRWFLTDMDRTFFVGTATGILNDMLAGEDVLRRLKTNTGFKQRLAQRYAAHMASTFKASRVQSIIAQMGSEVSAAVPRHVMRWAPDGTTETRRNNNIQQIKDYAALRTDNFAAEVSAELGVATAVNVTLGINNPAQGRVRVQGVPVEASTFKMFPNIPFTLQAVPAPGYAFSHWTGTAGGASVAVSIAGPTSLTAHFIPSGETVIGGTLAGNTTLGLAGSPYTLSSDLIVPPGTTLTIQAGVVLRLPAKRHIRIQGALTVNGTAAQKVSILGRDGERWGGLSLEYPTGPITLSHLTLRGATKGYDPTIYSSAITGRNATVVADFLDIAQCEGPFYVYGGTCTVRDSVLDNPYTGDCFHAKRGQATVQRCTFPGNNSPDTDAIDYDGVTNGLIEDCRIYRYQGSNSDGIDIGEACVNVLVHGNYIYFNSDKGISCGQGSTVTIARNLIVGCVLGVGVKDAGSLATIDQNTFASCGTGVAVYEKNFGSGGGGAIITNSIISRPSTPPVTVDALSTASIAYCLTDGLPMAGVGNLATDPLFVDPVVLNFQLQPFSPALNAGDPAHAPDPNLSSADIGAYYTYSPLHYPYTIGETVVINEVLSNSGAASDWIELHNRTATPVAIGGWFLSDSAADLAKYRIPPGTVIPAGGYLTFHEATNFGASSVDVNKITAFALSDVGETVYLSSAVNDVLTDYQTREDFGPSLEGETLGTYYKPSSDAYNFVAMRSPTSGAANSGPRIGPIVISEIMYHPAGNADAEYIELLNVTSSPVTLYDAAKAKAWRISDGIDYEFSATDPLVMTPGQRVVLTHSPAAFNALFGSAVPAGTRVFEWTTGGLDNGGESVQIDRPGAVDATNVIQYIRVDRVNYDDTTPWPSSSDGAGPSLTKLSEKDYGNDFINWTAVGASPGSAAPGSRFSSWATSHGVSAMSADPDDDGLDNLLEYALGTNPNAPSSTQPLGSASLGGRTTIFYQVDPAIPDVDYTLLASPDLHSWFRLDAPPVSMVGGLQTRSVSVRGSTLRSMAPMARQLLRPLPGRVVGRHQHRPGVWRRLPG